MVAVRLPPLPRVCCAALRRVNAARTEEWHTRHVPFATGARAEGDADATQLQPASAIACACVVIVPEDGSVQGARRKEKLKQPRVHGARA